MWDNVWNNLIIDWYFSDEAFSLGRTLNRTVKWFV